MKIETPFIAFLIAILFFGGVWAFFNNMASEYQKQGLMQPQNNITITNSRNEVISVDREINRLSQNSTETQKKLQENFGKLGLSLSGVVAAANIPLLIATEFINQIPLIGGMMSLTAQVLGIPVQITTTFLIILVILIIITALTIIFGGINQ